MIRILNDLLLRKKIVILSRLGLAAMLLGFSAIAPAQDAPPAWRSTTLTACFPNGGVPPFVTLAPEGDNSTARGIGVDLLLELIKPTGLTLRLISLPGQRCVELVRRGLGVQVIMFAESFEPTPDLLLTDVYYVGKAYFYYDRTRFPGGLDVERADRGGYKMCFLHGVNYARFFPGVTTVDATAEAIAQILPKLVAGRCEVAPLMGEVANVLMNPADVDRLAYIESVRYRHSVGLRFAVSARYEYASELTRYVNRQLDAMRRDGRLLGILRRYLGDKTEVSPP